MAKVRDERDETICSLQKAIDEAGSAAGFFGDFTAEHKAIRKALVELEWLQDNLFGEILNEIRKEEAADAADERVRQFRHNKRDCELRQARADKEYTERHFGVIEDQPTD